MVFFIFVNVKIIVIMDVSTCSLLNETYLYVLRNLLPLSKVAEEPLFLSAALRITKSHNL